jgi:putative ABC transport system permease protein
VKIETAASGIAAFIASYRDIIWAMRRLVAPAIWLTLALVISNAISIGVRERRTELAVLKVLGFRPWQIIFLVLGEGLLLGSVAGFVSAAGTLLLVNYYFNGIPFPIAFFPKFFVPMAALYWGPFVGGSAALVGSLIPAWNACRVKVTDVFARVT